jgi:hypothetical protein
MRLLTYYKALPRLQNGKGLAFVQVQGEGGTLRGPKKDSANKDEIKCFHFGIMGHYKK